MTALTASQAAFQLIGFFLGDSLFLACSLGFVSGCGFLLACFVCFRLARSWIYGVVEEYRKLVCSANTAVCAMDRMVGALNVIGFNIAKNGPNASVPCQPSMLFEPIQPKPIQIQGPRPIQIQDPNPDAIVPPSFLSMACKALLGIVCCPFVIQKLAKIAERCFGKENTSKLSPQMCNDSFSCTVTCPCPCNRGIGRSGRSENASDSDSDSDSDSESTSECREPGSTIKEKYGMKKRCGTKCEGSVSTCNDENVSVSFGAPCSDTTTTALAPLIRSVISLIQPSSVPQCEDLIIRGLVSLIPTIEKLSVQVNSGDVNGQNKGDPLVTADASNQRSEPQQHGPQTTATTVPTRSPLSPEFWKDLNERMGKIFSNLDRTTESNTTGGSTVTIPIADEPQCDRGKQTGESSISVHLCCPSASSHPAPVQSSESPATAGATALKPEPGCCKTGGAGPSPTPH